MFSVLIDLTSYLDKSGTEKKIANDIDASEKYSKDKVTINLRGNTKMCEPNYSNSRNTAKIVYVKMQVNRGDSEIELILVMLLRLISIS